MLSRNLLNQAGNGDSYLPSLSDLGLTFISEADNLLPGSTPGSADLLLLQADPVSLTRLASQVDQAVLGRQSLDYLYRRNGEYRLVLDGQSELNLGPQDGGTFSRKYPLLQAQHTLQTLNPDKGEFWRVNFPWQPSPPLTGTAFSEAGLGPTGRVVTFPGEAQSLLVVGIADDDILPRGLSVTRVSPEGEMESHYLPLQAFVYELDHGDLNGNGHQDLVVQVSLSCNDNPSGSPRIRVLWGDGLGGFSPGPEFAVDHLHTRPLLGNFNGDQHLDLLLVYPNTPQPAALPRLYWGAGDGTFAPGPEIELPTVGAGPVVEDFNGDGVDDLVRLDHDTKDLVVWLNNGSGGPITPQQRLNLETTEGLVTRVFESLDFDGNSDLDLVVDLTPTGKAEANLQVLSNDGQGTFSLGPSLPIFVGPDRKGTKQVHILQHPMGRFLVTTWGIFDLQNTDNAQYLSSLYPSLAVADFNDDGRPDLLRWVDSGLAILLGSEEATFGPERLIGEPSLNGQGLAGDFNSNLLLDLVDSDQFLQSEAPLQFQPGDAPWANSSDWLGVEDLNGDGHLDVLVKVPDGFQVYLGDGTGNFEPQPRQEVLGFWNALSPLTDLDQDGTIDLALIHHSGPGLSGPQVEFWKGLGDGTFVLHSIHPVSVLSTFSPHSKIADFTGNGFEDLWAEQFLFAQAPAVFGPPVSNSTLILGPIWAADLTGDGRAEVVGGGDGYYEGTDFSPSPRPACPGSTNYPDPARFRHLPSMTVVNPGQTGETVIEFESPPRSGPLSAWSDIAFEDLNGDGHLDAVILDLFGTLTLALGDGTGKLTQTDQFHHVYGSRSFLTRDFDFSGRFQKLVLGSTLTLIP